MAFSAIIPEHWTFVLGGVFIFIAVFTLTSSKRQQSAFWDRLRVQRRRGSAASTPPRSLSPEKSSGPPTTPSAPDSVNTFPPSRRTALAELTNTASGLRESTRTGLEPSPDFLRKNALPITQSYDLEINAPKYTPTGFSTEEVKALGDFPAYDILSGVPLPSPYLNFDPARALPRPYRPLRWAYHQTMSLNKLDTDWWLEVENTYVARIHERRQIFQKYGKMVLDYLPGSELACKELMEMCLQFYCARYPKLFSLSPDKKTFHNGILNSDTDIRSMHPLHVLMNNVPEDFGIVLRNESDGMYYFRAGFICSSLGWNVGTKIGMNLRDIHKPVPDYKEKMAFSMDRFFGKMPTNAPIQRGSWGLEVGSPLFMPPGDPHEKLRESQQESLAVEDCNLRVDWQTLRRLPLSAGIVFNFNALFTPVKEFRDEPYIPALAVKILKEGKKSLMEYKNTWHVEHVCIPELEKYAAEQVAKGLVVPENPSEEESWIPTTLKESPYFPGWEEKWHRQQGF